MITKVEQKRDCKYCTRVLVHLCVQEVIRTVLSLLCVDGQREKFRTGPWQNQVPWWVPNRTPRTFAAWHIYHQLSLLASTLLYCVWMQQLCSARLLWDAFSQPSWALLGLLLPEGAECIHGFWGLGKISQGLYCTLFASLRLWRPVWSLHSCEEIAACKKNPLTRLTAVTSSLETVSCFFCACLLFL